MANTLSVYYQFRRFAGLLNTPNIAIKKYFSDNKTLEIQGTNEPTAAQRNEFDQQPERNPNHKFHRPETSADYCISQYLEFLTALTAEAESLTAAITPKHQEQLLSYEPHIQKAPRLLLDQAPVVDSWPIDTPLEHSPGS